MGKGPWPGDIRHLEDGRTSVQVRRIQEGRFSGGRAIWPGKALPHQPGMCRITGGHAIRRGGQTVGYGKTIIRFGTYNIQNRRNSGIESALREMAQTNLELGVFQKTKVTDRLHMRNPQGYGFLAAHMPSRHCGGISIFYCNAPHFQVKAYQPHGPNVTSF